jgi:hypothetical protein
VAPDSAQVLRQAGLIADADIRDSDRYPAVNRLADLPGGGGFALYSEPCRAGRDVLVDLLLVSRIC